MFRCYEFWKKYLLQLCEQVNLRLTRSFHVYRLRIMKYIYKIYCLTQLSESQNIGVDVYVYSAGEVVTNIMRFEATHQVVMLPAAPMQPIGYGQGCQFFTGPPDYYRYRLQRPRLFRQFPALVNGHDFKQIYVI